MHNQLGLSYCKPVPPRFCLWKFRDTAPVGSQNIQQPVKSVFFIIKKVILDHLVYRGEWFKDLLSTCWAVVAPQSHKAMWKQGISDKRRVKAWSKMVEIWAILEIHLASTSMQATRQTSNRPIKERGLNVSITMTIYIQEKKIIEPRSTTTTKLQVIAVPRSKRWDIWGACEVFLSEAFYLSHLILNRGWRQAGVRLLPPFHSAKIPEWKYTPKSYIPTQPYPQHTWQHPPSNKKEQ